MGRTLKDVGMAGREGEGREAREETPLCKGHSWPGSAGNWSLGLSVGNASSQVSNNIHRRPLPKNDLPYCPPNRKYIVGETQFSILHHRKTCFPIQRHWDCDLGSPSPLSASPSRKASRAASRGHEAHDRLHNVGSLPPLSYSSAFFLLLNCQDYHSECVLKVPGR